MGTGWPYIVDFAVLERVRGRGVGSALMDAVEELIVTVTAARDEVFLKRITVY